MNDHQLDVLGNLKPGEMLPNDSFPSIITAPELPSIPNLPSLLSLPLLPQLVTILSLIYRIKTPELLF